MSSCSTSGLNMDLLHLLFTLFYCLTESLQEVSGVSVCIEIFFSVNIGDIFIIVAGLWYSFPIYLPEMRSQLKEKHKRRAYK